MSNSIEAQIIEAEERLRLAMIDSDVKIFSLLLGVSFLSPIRHFEIYELRSQTNIDQMPIAETVAKVIIPH